MVQNQSLEPNNPYLIRIKKFPSRGQPQQGFSHARISMNREMDSLFSTHHKHTQVQRIVEEGEDTGAKKEEGYCCRESILLFCGFPFCVDSIPEEVAGFSPFMVSLRKKHRVHCLLCLIDVLVILSVKDPNNASLMLKN